MGDEFIVTTYGQLFGFQASAFCCIMCWNLMCLMKPGKIRDIMMYVCMLMSLLVFLEGCTW